MVFAGTFNGQIFGVKMLSETFISKSYIRHVKLNCIPEIKALNGGSLIGARWQQDGASIHRNPNFMEYMDQQFDGRVLAKGAETHGRRGHSWAPRSPDLTVCDFALWPILKRRVYLNPRPRTLEALEERILTEIAELNQEREVIIKCQCSKKRRTF